MSVQVGAPAPKFDLESDDGTRRTLRDYGGKWLVLYFYPRDNTPGCTREAQDFSSAAGRLRKLGAEVAGVSKDSVKSHGGFRDRFDLRFPLLSDPDLAAHKAYEAWGTKTMYGKKIEGALRTTFLIAPDGTVAQIWKSVKVDGHADKVIAALSADPAATTAGPKKTPAAGKAPASKSPSRARMTGDPRKTAQRP